MSDGEYDDGYDDTPVVMEVGYVCARAGLDDGKETEVIGLLYTQEDDEQPDFWMTIGAAKMLIETLKEAVDTALSHDRKSRDEL